MNRDFRWKLVWAGLACAVGLLDGGTVNGQSLGTPPAVGVGTLQGLPGTGPSAMPFPLAMPMIAPLNPNAAASSGTDVAGNPVQGNVFANPYMLPFFYGSMMPGGLGTGATSSSSSSTSSLQSSMGMDPTQLGLMMLATQNPNGVGSGRLSGVRGGASPSRPQAPTQPQTRRLSNQPGGLAARYFRRGTPRSILPRNYYNRQSRYFP